MSFVGTLPSLLGTMLPFTIEADLILPSPVLYNSGRFSLVWEDV